MIEDGPGDRAPHPGMGSHGATHFAPDNFVRLAMAMAVPVARRTVPFPFLVYLFIAIFLAGVPGLKALSIVFNL
jgi:hypothetical protein